MENKCKKKKVDKIKAMLIIANAQKASQKDFSMKKSKSAFVLFTAVAKSLYLLDCKFPIADEKFSS